MSSVNPYAAPKARVDDVSGASPDAEAIRREHITHETSVRSIGTLYYIGGFILLGIAASFFFGRTTEVGGALLTVIEIFYVVLGALSIVVGRGIRQLKPWARVTTIVLSIVGLIGFPVGTLINGCILYLLFAAKGRRIFAADYAGIVAATPHVKTRTSIAVWIVLGVLVLFVAVLVLLSLSP